MWNQVSALCPDARDKKMSKTLNRRVPAAEEEVSSVPRMAGGGRQVLCPGLQEQRYQPSPFTAFKPSTFLYHIASCRNQVGTKAPGPRGEELETTPLSHTGLWDNTLIIKKEDGVVDSRGLSGALMLGMVRVVLCPLPPPPALHLFEQTEWWPSQFKGRFHSDADWLTSYNPMSTQRTLAPRECKVQQHRFFPPVLLHKLSLVLWILTVSVQNLQ